MPKYSKVVVSVRGHELRQGADGLSVGSGLIEFPHVQHLDTLRRELLAPSDRSRSHAAVFHPVVVERGHLIDLEKSTEQCEPEGVVARLFFVGKSEGPLEEWEQ